MKYSIKTLEFNQIKNTIKNYSKTMSAKDFIEHLEPSFNIELVTKLLNETNEMTNFIARFQSIPLIEDFDIYKLLENALKDYQFNIDELLQFRLFFKMELDVLSFFKAHKETEKTYKNLYSYVEQITSHYNILDAFYEVMDDKGFIYDQASKELFEIRKKMHNIEYNIQTKMQQLLIKYQSYLNENVIVMRNDRFCLAVKESYKQSIKGVIHDMSQTKQTVYIEPEATRVLTQELEHLKLEETYEIYKILNKLSSLIKDKYETIKINMEIFINLDIIQSKAKYALELNAVMPRVNDKGYIELLSAKHPLLDQKTAVPIDIKLNDDFDTILITGPNTGGKTVALKTLGLLTLMTSTGILIPAKQESHVSLFKQIFADIGDEQSISQSLSTFSSHMKRITYMVDNVSDMTLILLDELGSGTDPHEGVSLAISIIEFLRQYNIRMIVTTHYSELKQYAYETEKMATASVAFDIETLKPMYKLTLGSIGSSHAISIAERLGLNKQIINKAFDLQNSKTTDLAKMIEKLNNQIRENEIEKEIYESKRKALETEIALYEESRKSLINRQSNVLEELKNKEQSKFEKKFQELNDLIMELRAKNIINHKDLTEIKSRMNKNDQTIITFEEDIELNVGDQVYIRSYDQYGVVKKVKDDAYVVKFGMFELTFSRNDLVKEKETKQIKKEKIIRKQTKTPDLQVKSIKTEVDLRGFRYEEVKEALDDAIDRALLSNINSLRIIHGFGTGVIRKAVYDYIKKSPHIKDSRYGGEGEGLNGVTIVTLK